jgi:hypothetical protein
MGQVMLSSSSSSNTFGASAQASSSSPNMYTFPDHNLEMSDYASSPLVKACTSLYSINHAKAIVDVCLACAANFGGSAVGTAGETYVNAERYSGRGHGPDGGGAPDGAYDWEVGLYKSGSSSSSNGIGGTVGTTGTLSSSNSTALVSRASGDLSDTGGGAMRANDVCRFCYSLVLHFLHVLLRGGDSVALNEDSAMANDGDSNSNPQQLAEQMLSVCGASQDVEFHKMLYASLLKGNYTSMLLRLHTPYLEEWLATYTRPGSSNGAGDGVDLLYRYYTVHQMYGRASHIMEHQSRNTVDKDVTLAQRIECLTRAIASASASFERRGQVIPGDL